MNFLIFLSTWLFTAVIFNITTNVNINKYSDIFNYRNIILTCIYIPIIEESFFRCTLPTIIGDYNVINSILFGLYHIGNYCHIPKWKHVLYQVIMSIFVGLYINSLDDIRIAIIFHGLYNFASYSLLYVLQKYLHPVKEKVTKPKPKNMFLKYKRSKSCDSIDVCIDSMVDIKDSELIDLFDKYDKIRNKRIKNNRLPSIFEF